MIPTLPASDPTPQQRAAELAKARDTYQYNYGALPPVAMAASVPEADRPPLAWDAKVTEAGGKLMVNSALIHGEKDAGPAPPAPVAAPPAPGAEPGSALKSILLALRNFTLEGHTSGRATTLAAFDGLFRAIPLPPIARDFQEDLTFARMRVAGPNPLELRRVRSPGDQFPVSNAQYRRAIGDDRDSLEAAGAEGRLYLTDYTELAGLPCSAYPSVQKYLAAPLGLFAVPRTGAARDLRPIAIQLGPHPGPENPCFTPGNGWGWMTAKTLLSTADGNHHEAVRHLAHTHLVLEPLVLATRRQLSSNHPLSILLLPHFEGTLAINNAANTALLAPDGGVAILMPGDIQAVRDYAAQAAHDWDFNDNMFPRALERRGVADPETLPYYPYRDDGLLLWNAIHEWAAAYLRIYYQSAADVQADTELQAWCAELLSPDGGRMKGFGQSGRIETLEYLIDAVTHIIFTASAQHAAVNFPQYKLMSLASAYPLAAYHPIPRVEEILTEAIFLEYLPPLEFAHYQLGLGYLLGSVQYGQLGRYPQDSILGSLEARLFHRQDGYFADPRVHEPLAAFQRRLEEIEATIQERNRHRVPYEYLLPSHIPQSTNI